MIEINCFRSNKTLKVAEVVVGVVLNFAKVDLANTVICKIQKYR